VSTLDFFGIGHRVACADLCSWNHSARFDL